MSQEGKNGAALWTLRELAEFLRVTVGSAYKMVCRGQLPPKAVFRLGKRLRIRSAIVLSWLERGAA